MTSIIGTESSYVDGRLKRLLENRFTAVEDSVTAATQGGALAYLPDELNISASYDVSTWAEFLAAKTDINNGNGSPWPRPSRINLLADITVEANVNFAYPVYITCPNQSAFMLSGDGQYFIDFDNQCSNWIDEIDLASCRVWVDSGTKLTVIGGMTDISNDGAAASTTYDYPHFWVSDQASLFLLHGISNQYTLGHLKVYTGGTADIWGDIYIRTEAGTPAIYHGATTSDGDAGRITIYGTLRAWVGATTDPVIECDPNSSGLIDIFGDIQTSTTVPDVVVSNTSACTVRIHGVIEGVGATAETDNGNMATGEGLNVLGGHTVLGHAFVTDGATTTTCWTKGGHYHCDTSSNNVTLTLPASASARIGDKITVTSSDGTNTTTVAVGSGEYMSGVLNGTYAGLDNTLTVNFVFMGGVLGWVSAG